MVADTLVYENKNQIIRVAGLTDGVLQTLEIADLSKAAEGNIYLGRISKKVELANGKLGYFVNLGEDREAFINAEEHGRDDLNANEGQEVVVQVAQEQRAEKGARLVRSLQFVGRFVVYCPYRMNVEVSAKIADKLKADELKTLVQENTTGQEGWVVRTSAVYADEAELTTEMENLRAQFDAVRQKAKTSKAPALLMARNNVLSEAISRSGQGLRKIVVNDHNLQKELEEKFAVEFSANPFAEFGLEDAILEALQKEVRLKSGGRISIEETRACTAIDVDSGEDDGLGSLGRLNMEAAAEIARQIRLRNLSGKIVVDFAGSSEYRYLKSAIEALEEELQHDYIKTSVQGLSRAGLVEIVRVRRRPSLQDILSTECPTCQGTGRVEK